MQRIWMLPLEHPGLGNAQTGDLTDINTDLGSPGRSCSPAQRAQTQRILCSDTSALLIVSPFSPEGLSFLSQAIIQEKKINSQPPVCYMSGAVLVSVPQKLEV